MSLLLSGANNVLAVGLHKKNLVLEMQVQIYSKNNRLPLRSPKQYLNFWLQSSADAQALWKPRTCQPAMPTSETS
jgi:hypothetical protein